MLRSIDVLKQSRLKKKTFQDCPLTPPTSVNLNYQDATFRVKQIVPPLPILCLRLQFSNFAIRCHQLMF